MRGVIQERKRAVRAMPDPEPGKGSTGCILIVILYAVITLAAYARTSHVGFVLAAAPALALCGVGVVSWIRKILLLARVARAWRRAGVTCLVVHSNSPNWAEHIATIWMPRLGSAARTLDWSLRSKWSSTLEVRVFRQFVQARRNFNPAVVVFRGVKAPLVFRFYYAFVEARRGRPEYLEELQQRMFDGVDRAGHPKMTTRNSP